jgi:nitroreductase
MLELHPLLATRWSPRAFDPAGEVSDAELSTLLEAARWAPSKGNSQPWRFVVGRRGTESHKRIFTNLRGHNQRWAGDAAVLLVAAHLTGSSFGYAAYDLGQAMAHLSIQAGALGLHVHQMAGFAADSMAGDLELPDSVVPKVVAAIGRLGDPDRLPEDLRTRETALRVRQPLADLIL